jgi:hypothetical protein
MAVIEPTVGSVRRPAAAVSGAVTGTLLVREPTDCRSIWRRGQYRRTDPDSNIRPQLMRWKAPRHHYKPG